MQEVTNFARFYALLKRMPGADKQLLVYQHTNGRTDSLRELSTTEYNALCDDMERATGYDKVREALRQELRHRRSVVLKLMQRLGVDTTDWARVDNFCMHPRIVGKVFRRLDTEELEALAVKLRAIERKGGIRNKNNDNTMQTGGMSYILMNISPTAIKN